MKVSLQASALEDLRQLVDFHELREPGLGISFRKDVFADLRRLGAIGGVHRRFGKLHRMLSARFSVWIYYRVDADTSFVVAVLDARQEPRKIDRRIRVEQRRAG